MMNDKEICTRDYDGNWICTATGNHCHKVAQHLQRYEAAVARCAAKKENYVFYTGESNLCVDVKCDLYKRVRDLAQKTK